MIKLACKGPFSIEIALSGGPDSVAALAFLSRGHRQVSAAFVHHGTETSEKSYEVVREVCDRLEVPLRHTRLSSVDSKESGLEATWRKQRYEFLEHSRVPVVTAHHLDDAVEWWVFSSLHGKGKLIPRARGIYLRPFLLTRKEKLIEY